MEKKKMKLWKKILIVICIIICLFLIHAIRNMIIIKSLQNKADAYANLNNYYVKSTQYEGSQKTLIENYHKDNKHLMKLQVFSEGITRKMSVYSDGETTNSYIEVEASEGIEKVASLNSTGFPLVTPISEWLYTDNVGQFILLSSLASIKNAEVNGKSCYQISNFYTTSMLLPADTNFYFCIEKDTGLNIRSSNGTIEDENGNTIQFFTDYEYQFGVATDEDFVEPDISEYVIAGNGEE